METQTNRVWPCLPSCFFGLLFSQTQTLLQVNICSVSARRLSNIDLLIWNTQLSAKPDCVIIIQRGSGYILCDGLAVAVGGPWPGSLMDPAQQSGGTWCKYWARGALQCWFCYSGAVINAGAATGAPYLTVLWMTAVKSCCIMRGGRAGAASQRIGQWMNKKEELHTKRLIKWESEEEASNSNETSLHWGPGIFKVRLISH